MVRVPILPFVLPVIFVATACSSSPPPAPAGSGAAVPSAVAPTAAPTATPNPPGAISQGTPRPTQPTATPRSTSGDARGIIDLRLTGARTLTLQGRLGKCAFREDNGGNYWEWYLAAAEVREVGNNIFVSAYRGVGDFSWSLAEGVGWGFGEGVHTVSADQKTYTFDADLGPFVNSNPGAEHVVGTVACP